MCFQTGVVDPTLWAEGAPPTVESEGTFREAPLHIEMMPVSDTTTTRDPVPDTLVALGQEVKTV